MTKLEKKMSLALPAIGVVLGALSAIALVPAWTPGLESSLSGSGKTAVWYLARSSGFVAYGLLWLSVVLGLWLSNRLARLWPSGPVAFELHEFASLLGLAAASLHALVLLGDAHWGGTPYQIFVPFASPRGRLWMGLGQVAFWLSAFVTASFYLRKRLGQRAWRLIHFASFALYVLALGHALLGGTESRLPLGRAFYWLSGGSVLFLTVYRGLGVAFTSKRGFGPSSWLRRAFRRSAPRGRSA